MAARRAPRKPSTPEHPHFEKLPRRLSPSRAADFMQCPKLFEYKTIHGLSSPPTIQTTRGTLAHEAFERIFDHEPGTRTPELAITYLRPAWAALTDETVTDPDPQRQERLRARARGYAELAPAGSQAEAELLSTAEDAVRSWFAMERVNNFTPPTVVTADGTELDGREMHVAADLFTDRVGVNLHGYIDRLDKWENGAGQTVWSVSDYKTGKVPGAGKRYAPHTMEKIRYESFFQLRVYAVLCKDMLDIDVKYLRLIYVATGDRDNGIKQMVVTPQILEDTRREIATVWTEVVAAAKTGQWETKKGPLCPYCFFVDVCPAFNPQLAGVPVTDDLAS